MNKNYMIYPMKYMRITQNYSGTASHLKHTTGTPKDYPIDEAGKDTGRDAIYCPCDEMVITAIRGYQNSNITNTIWLVSTSKVTTPTFEDIVFMTLTHENDSDLKGKKVGDKFRRGDIICYEGTDGATANHIHITAGRGSSNAWQKSSTGAWVTTGDTKKPEEVFFLDPNFTEVLSSNGLRFTKLLPKKIGTPINRNTQIDQLEIIVTNLNARLDPSLNAKKLGYITPGIYNYQETIEKDNYTWYKIEDFWVAYNPNWINILAKEAPVSPPTEEYIEVLETEPVLIFTAKETKYYKIFLKENAKLYLKDF